MHSETSTGVVADVQALAQAAREAGAITVVDAVSSLGAVPLETDAWGLDVVVAGSQKALMTPPGLSLTTVSAAAWERCARTTTPRVYFDWTKLRASLETGTTPFTPAVSLVVSLDKALELLLEEGLEAAFARHAALGRACREGAKAMGLTLFSPDEERSAIVTAILTPDGVDARELVLALRERFGITVAGGHGELGGADVPHRTHRLLRRLRHHDRALGGGGAPRRGRRGHRARRRRQPRARGVPRSRQCLRRRPRVLIREPIAESGLELLRERFDVVEDPDSELGSIIGEFEAIVVRSGTTLDAELIERASRLKVIGRAGVGVDNVDVDAATRRGIVVANAPEATVVSAAEHTIALAARRCAQRSPGTRRADRGKLGARAVRRHRARRERPSASWGSGGSAGRSRAARSASACGSSPTTRTSRSTASESSESSLRRRRRTLYAEADFITLHLPLNDQTRGLLGRDAFEHMRDGVRVVNAARGGLIDEDALVDALRSGKVAGAALDVFESEPYSGPLLELEQVVVTPHLAGSTTEAQDRAGLIIAEQVAAALDGELVRTAVNIPVVEQADLEVLGAFIPLAAKLGRLAVALLAGRPTTIVVAAHGPLSEYDTRLLTVAALNGVFQGRVDQAVNYVNAPVIAAERGIDVSEQRFAASQHYTNLVRVVVAGAREGTTEEIEVSGTTIGPEPRLFLAGALGFAIDIELAPRMAFLVYDDKPGRHREGRDDVRRGRREHREHGRLAHEGGRKGADGLLDRQRASTGAARARRRVGFRRSPLHRARQLGPAVDFRAW